MTDAEATGDIRRILVALDASPHSVAALEAAVELAAGLHAELLGLFVEDVNLLKLAQLPFASEVLYASPTARPMSVATMERALQTQARRVREQLRSAAEAAGAPWSFEVKRGRVETELLAYSPDVDLLILGRLGHSPRARGELGSTARAVVARAGCTVFLTHRHVPVDQPVAAWYDGSEPSRRALAIAARLARHDDRNIVILVPESNAQALQQEASQLLEGLKLQGCFRVLEGESVNDIAAAMRAVGGKLLVASADSGHGEASRLPEALECPVVLVRRSGSSPSPP